MKLSKVILIVIILYKHFIQEEGAEVKEPETLGEKIKLAEKFLKEYERDVSSFLDDIEKRESSEADIRGGYFNKFSKIFDKYVQKTNALKLQCPTVAKDPGYIRWTKRFRKREKRIVDRANKSFERVIKRGLKKHF